VAKKVLEKPLEEVSAVLKEFQDVCNRFYPWCCIDLLVSSKKHTSISLCVTVFLIDALLADIPNPQLFQNKIFIDK